MNKSVARSLGFLIIAMMSFVTVSVMLSTDASAASVSGTWVSRVAGQGYVQTYMGLSGDTLTDSFDVELVLSGGSSITGTMTTIENGVPRTHTVEGSFDGTIFLMTADLGWDGWRWLAPLYTLTVSGNEMSGSGSYVNAGVTIYSTIDVKKEGVFGGLEVAGGMAPAVSAVVIAISIVAIVVASTPVKIPPAPQGYQPQVMSPASQGFQPQVISGQSPQYSYQPSIQSETPSAPIGPPEATDYVGGVGITGGEPNFDQNGRPYPPRRYTGANGPRCPIHNEVPCQAMFPFQNQLEPGSWYCGKCAALGHNNGYPWGVNPPPG